MNDPYNVEDYDRLEKIRAILDDHYNDQLDKTDTIAAINEIAQRNGDSND